MPLDTVASYHRFDRRWLTNSNPGVSRSGQVRRSVRRGRSPAATPPRERRAKDRRVQKTEALLRGALGALIREKPYDEIVVKEVLSRANVGRSTFYTHFAGKDALLRGCIRDILRAAEPRGGRATAGPHERVAWFSLPILEHIERHRRAGQPAMDPRGRRTVHQQLRHALAELIESEVRTALRRGRGTARPSPDLLVRRVASTFVLVLDWWVESDTPLPAPDADRLFRGLIEPSLAEAFR
jgi:AcrR family transcriptional regulator